MTRVWLKAAATAAVAVLALGGLSACGNGEVLPNCEDPQPYQSVVDGKRLEVPEDLAPLDELKEIPIPKAAKSAEAVQAQRKCLESPPSILSGQ